MRLSKLVLSLCAVLPAGAAEASVPAHAGLVRAGHEVSMSVGAQGYDGAFVQVGRYASELRGTVLGRSLQATVKVDGVSGVLGGTALDLHVAREPVGIVVARGLYQGQLADLRLSSDAIRGNVGRCSYDLIRHGEGFSGSSSCGAPPVATQLQLPAALEDRSDSERALAVCFLLGPAQPEVKASRAGARPFARQLATGSSSAGNPPRMTVAPPAKAHGGK